MGERWSFGWIFLLSMSCIVIIIFISNKEVNLTTNNLMYIKESKLVMIVIEAYKEGYLLSEVPLHS
jgi:hypothetical protein